MYVHNMKGKFLLGIALLALGVTSCKEKDIAFDQEAYNELVKKSFVTDNVDPQHTWATSGTAIANVTVNGDYGATYHVGIYLNNPMGSGNVTRLYYGQVQSGNTLQTSVTYPLSQDYVYIAIYDKDGRRIIMNAPIKNGMITASYGSQSAAGARRATEAEEAEYAETVDDYLSPESPNSWTTVNPITVADMKAYTAITDDILANETSNGNHTLSDKSWFYSPEDFPGHGDGKHYRVAAGTEITEVFHINGTQNVINDCVIYIEGKVHLKGNTLNGPTLVVASGGEIVIDGETNMSNAGRIVVMAGGKITGTKGYAYNINNGGINYNAGEINTNGTLNLNGSRFYNCGTVNADVLTGTADNTTFINFGRITARTNSFAGSTYNQSLVNGCYIHYTESAGLGNSVLLTGSRIDIDGDCTPMAGTCEMHNQSELNVGGMLKLNGNTFVGPTNEGDYAIVKTDKMYATHGGAISVSGLVYFDFDPDEIYGKYNNDALNYKRTMSDNDYSYSAAGWIVNNVITHWVNESNALNEISIPEGCGGTGFNADGNDGDDVVEGTPIGYRYCFEDNFPDAGDYDFNDVVMTVTPSVNDKTLTLRVSLDAVGATKTIGACVRLKGLSRSKLASDPVATQSFTPLPENLAANYANINTSKTFLDGNESPNLTSDMVIVLFKDAHWTINPELGNGGAVQNMFYNTVKRDVASNKAYVTPKEAVYTFTFNSAEDASDMLAESLYDVFIVEPYNGGFWEVHTVQNGFKTAQVITPLKGKASNGMTYEEAYGTNMPWAIMVPITADFKFQYPVEWQPIGWKKNGSLDGAYKTSGHSFGEWAENSSTATDWYKYPESDLVFDEEATTE